MARRLTAVEAVEPHLQLDLTARPPTVKLTHYLFRYPAKFHPPVAAALIERFTEPGDVILDPFVGSGTALIEGAFLDRACFGVDVDPVAVAVAHGKTRRYDVDEAR
jgi:23S rRNA G2445 N2-methylase RlmL